MSRSSQDFNDQKIEYDFYIFSEENRVNAINNVTVTDPAKRMPKRVYEMVGGVDVNARIDDLGNTRVHGFTPSVMLSMIDDARQNAPSMIGARLNFPKSPNPRNGFNAELKSGDFLTYGITDPLKSLWEIAWPSQSLFRGGQDVALFFLHVPNVLFYGISTYLEYGLRVASAILLKPMSLVLFGKGGGFNIGSTEVDHFTLSIPARIALLVLTGGIPLVLGFIGQMFLFSADLLRHTRIALDSVTNFFTSVLGIFSKNYGVKFPTVQTCVVSLLRNLPALMFDALLIAACFIPGGQIATLLSSVGAGPVISALSAIFSPILHGPVVTALGTAFSSFFSLATNAMGMALGSLTVASTVATMGNVANAIFETVHTFMIFPIANGIQKWWNKRKVSHIEEDNTNFNTPNEVMVESEPDPTPAPPNTDASVYEILSVQSQPTHINPQYRMPLTLPGELHLREDAYKHNGTFSGAQPGDPNELPSKSEFSLSHSPSHGSDQDN